MSCTATLGYSSTWPWWSWGPSETTGGKTVFSLFIFLPQSCQGTDTAPFHGICTWVTQMQTRTMTERGAQLNTTVFSGSDPSWTLSGMHVRPSIQEKTWQWMKEWWHAKQTQEWLSTWKPSQPGGASSCLFLRTHQMDIQSGTKIYNCSNLLSPVFLRSSFLPLFWIFWILQPQRLDSCVVYLFVCS